jgi:hypothetical protein
MPTFVHGKDADLFWNGYDVTSAFRSVDAERKQDTPDVTCFGDSAKRVQVGIVDGMLSAEGIYDAAAVGTPDTDTVLRAALEAAEPLVSYAPEGSAIGKPVEGVAGPETGYSIESPATDIIAVKCSLQSSHGLERMLSLHDMVAQTAGTNNYASIDNGASSALGIVAYLHVTSVTAGNVAVKVQHSVDDAVWVDLVTFVAVTNAQAPQAQRIVVAGTVNRYLRAQSVLTTGPATWHVAAGRKPRNG